VTARQVGALLLLAAVSAAAGFGVYSWQHRKGTAVDPRSEQVAKKVGHLPEFVLPDLDGQARHSSEWSGKVLVLNFWATWCPPCRKEIPGFIKIQARHADRGVRFVGIAIDDPVKVREFARRMGINYPTLLGDESSPELSRRLGNRHGGLPFTAIFDRSGALIYARAGELHPEALLQRLEPLLKSAAI
jgi:thiol-disulfide isomerase/thioredoxin